MRPRTKPRDPDAGVTSTVDAAASGIARSGGNRIKEGQARTGLAVGLGGVLIVALVAMAVIFSIARGTTNVATSGTAGIYGEASLSAAAAARNRTVQAQLIGKALAAGVAVDVDLAQSLSRAEAAANELVRRTEGLTRELEDSAVAQRIASRAAAFVTAVANVVELIQTGSLAASDVAIESELESSYGELVRILADERDKDIAQIALAREDAGRLADAARFLVALLVPLGVLLAYRARTRRELKQDELEQELTKQQAVSRTKDEFIANLSHELRTPLTSIYGFALEMIEQSANWDPELATELAVLIASESGELDRMVEDLLTTGTADQDGLVVVIGDVDPAAEVAAVVAPLTATGVEIELRMESALISSDRLRLRQIVRNLVSNAQRHGGPNISIVGRIDGSRYAIEVQDDGPGVPAELEDRLFSRFIHQGDAPLLTGSVGLGLSIAHLLAARTGGTIAYRHDGSETVFSVTFPLASSESA